MVRALADGLEVTRSEAVRAWLEDEAQEGGAITYITDPDAAIVVDAYEALPAAFKDYARDQVLKTQELARQTVLRTSPGGREVRTTEDVTDDMLAVGDSIESALDQAGL